ncbi:hypothetical protein LIS04_153 [Listeria phage LIS04]|nr:hypothetical protein LIS04_153 [Listeria phage LIS04]
MALDISLVDHTKREFEQLFKHSEMSSEFKDMAKKVNQVVELIEEVASDEELVFISSILNRLLNYKPMTELTGEDWEWKSIDDSNLEQNIRYSGVYRWNKDNSTAVNTNARICSYDGGESFAFTNDSSQSIEFPYVVPEAPEGVVMHPSTTGIERQVIAEIDGELREIYIKDVPQFDDVTKLWSVIGLAHKGDKTDWFTLLYDNGELEGDPRAILPQEN